MFSAMVFRGVEEELYLLIMQLVVLLYFLGFQKVFIPYKTCIPLSKEPSGADTYRCCLLFGHQHLH